MTTSPSTYGSEPNTVIVAAWEDPSTGAVYVHKDLDERLAPFVLEEHIPPVKASHAFGDVDGFSAYLLRYGKPETTLITWNHTGFKATLDYHTKEAANRAQWEATYPFVLSPSWKAWTALANGQAVSQKAAVEFLESHQPDILTPPATDLMNLLRNLRANVTATATTELRPDGTTNVAFSQDKRVGQGQLELPPTIQIAIPVLRGDGNSTFSIGVRLRTSVDDQAHLAFRFSMERAEDVLETVYTERVAQAEAALGDEYTILRAAD